MPPKYEVRVCPVCLEQVDEDSYEESGDHYHEDHGSVKPVTVACEPQGLDSAVGLALFQLQDQRRELAFTKAERAWFRSLPQEEQDRLEAERRAKLSPIARTFEDLMRSALEDMSKDLTRQQFWGESVVLPDLSAK